MFDDPASSRPAPESQPAPETADQPASAEAKFRSCRWYTADAGASAHCTHRDVLPFAGTTGFKPEAWCPECAFYKLRRTPKKRERSELGY